MKLLTVVLTLALLLTGCADRISFDRAAFALQYGEMYTQAKMLLKHALADCGVAGSARTKEHCDELKATERELRALDKQVRPAILTPKQSVDTDALMQLLGIAMKVAI